eukprot:CAMPEP_0175089938 /NCGR_PEP_ID=MMETSP0086_2-20121207/1058_1 /TAXON_ID=136419 /ORGANISM="Unknown Unknown, Strain D1" /LENGTH=108 /DNA_ID=CAMNT_0016362491 /DNA_START=193 /DNA_END=519 /DNA_ORIENTATION=+
MAISADGKGIFDCTTEAMRAQLCSATVALTTGHLPCLGCTPEAVRTYFGEASTAIAALDFEGGNGAFEAQPPGQLLIATATIRAPPEEAVESARDAARTKLGEAPVAL